MKIMKLTADRGIFYNADHGPELIKQMLLRVPGWQKIELIEMSEEEYFSIPATSEAAGLWREP